MVMVIANVILRSTEAGVRPLYGCNLLPGEVERI